MPGCRDGVGVTVAGGSLHALTDAGTSILRLTPGRTAWLTRLVKIVFLMFDYRGLLFDSFDYRFPALHYL